MFEAKITVKKRGTASYARILGSNIRHKRSSVSMKEAKDQIEITIVAADSGGAAGIAEYRDARPAGGRQHTQGRLPQIGSKPQKVKIYKCTKAIYSGISKVNLLIFSQKSRS